MVAISYTCDMMTLEEFVEEYYKSDDEKALAQEYEQYLRKNHPGVKEAWEQYQTILNLTFNVHNEDFIKHREEQKKREIDQKLEILKQLSKMR